MISPPRFTSLSAATFARAGSLGAGNFLGEQ
jgi:hypothetical protein